MNRTGWSGDRGGPWEPPRVDPGLMREQTRECHVEIQAVADPLATAVVRVAGVGGHVRGPTRRHFPRGHDHPPIRKVELDTGLGGDRVPATFVQEVVVVSTGEPQVHRCIASALAAVMEVLISARPRRPQPGTMQLRSRARIMRRSRPRMTLAREEMPMTPPSSACSTRSEYARPKRSRHPTATVAVHRNHLGGKKRPVAKGYGADVTRPRRQFAPTRSAPPASGPPWPPRRAASPCSAAPPRHGGSRRGSCR